MTRLRSSLARKGNRLAVLASFISYLMLSSGLPVIPVASAVTPPSVPTCNPSSTFDSGFATGSVNGQGSWKATGAYDQAIVDNTYGYSSFGCKSLRISNAVTSGAFGDQTFAAPTADPAGESSIASNNHFDAQFDIAATQPGVETGLTLSVSPDDGNGSRMSYLSFTDEPDGIHVVFYDVTDNGPLGTTASFNPSEIATLSRSAPHTIRFSIDFVDGPGNDVVNIYIDGSLVHTGTTWEDYYRFDPEQSGNGNKLFPIDTLIFRAGGTAAPSTSGKGFLFDNFSLATVNLPIDTSIIQFVNSPKYVRENNGGDLDAQIVAPTTATAVNFYVDGSSTPIPGTNVGGATATTDWWRLYTPLPAGQHTITAKVDIANTWYDASNTGTVYSLDLPTASYVIPQAGQYFRPNDKVVRVKADDEFDQFNYMKTTINSVTHTVNRADCSDQGNYVLCDLQNLNLPEGTYTADTTTYTKANNRYDHLISDPFTIDGTKPSVTSLTIENESGGVVAGTADAAAEATDNDGVESVNFYMTLPRLSDGQCTGNGTQLTSQRIATPDGDGKYRASLDVSSLSDGDYCVTAVARDNAWNNSSPVNQKVTVHNVVPAHNIRFTKYECLNGTSVSRAANGPDGSGNVTVPANCWTESGAEFGYIYQAGKMDYTGPYTGYGDSTPYTSVGMTDASGTVLATGLSDAGRYDVAVLNGDGTYSQPKAGLAGFFCAGTDSGDGTNNYEIAFAPHNGTTYCVAYDTIDPQCTPSNASAAGYWRLDELTAGSTAVDSVGSNDGTPHNNPTPSMDVPGGLSFGDPRSLDFDGTQYVDLGNSLSNTTNFTVSAWVNPSSLASDRQIISKGYNGTDTQWELKTSTNDGKVSFRAWNGSAVGVQSLTPLVANQWTHVVGTYDGTTWKIYLNGVLDNSAVAGAPVATTRDLVIGGVDANGTVIQNWQGKIDDVRIYNTALTDAQVAELGGGQCSYTESSSSSSASSVSSSTSSVVACMDNTASLVAHWNFDENTGSTVNDLAGANDAGTISGATWTSTIPSLAYGNTSALSFNGSSDHVTVGDVASLEFDTNNQFSASAWVDPSSFSGYQTVIHKIDDTNSARRGYLFTIDNGKPEVWILHDFGAGNYLRVAANTTLSTGSWQQIGFSYDGSGLASGVKIYINGADVTGSAVVDALSGTIQNAQPFEIGYRTAAHAQPYAGLMDEVRVYNAALNASQMAELAGGSCSVTPASSSSSSAASSLAACTTTDIAGYWKLDEGSGTTTADSTGLGHDGTLQNGPLWTTGDPAISPNTAALSFDGTDNFVSVANSSDFYYGTHDFTVSAFVKTTTGNESILGDFNGSSPYRGWGLYVYSNNNVNFFGYGDQGINDASQAGGTVLDGNWHNLVGVYHRSGNTLTIDTYVDGVLAGSHSATVGNISANSSLLFGYYRGQENNTFNGSLDDVRVYGRALSASEISQINAGCTNVVTSSSSSSAMSSAVSSAATSSAASSQTSSSTSVTFLGFSTPQHTDDGNGGYHGHQTDVLGNVFHFLSNFFLGGHTAPGGFGGIAPGGFGGANTFTGAEHDLICSTKKALPLNATESIIEWAAGVLASEMGKSQDAVLSALKDSNFCPEPTKHTAAVTKPIAFHVNAAGYPVSSNPTWNACIQGNVTLQDIRNNPDKDENGRGLDCAAYHNDNLWRQPDLNIFFTWDPKTKTVTLPSGYVVVNDAPALH